MKKCISGRQTGKTTKLIKLSAEKQIPILVKNETFKKMIKSHALNMDMNIPDPISVIELMSDEYMNGIDSIDNIIVDDAEYILKYILSFRKVRSMEAISICTSDPDDELI